MANIFGTNANDTLTGTEQSDRIFGRFGNNSISGVGGNDSLFGEIGDDTLNGNDGNDALYGGDDIDGLFGGDGNDLLVGGSGDDNFLSVFGGLYGGDGNDRLYGDSGNDRLEGGYGNDLLYGGDGDDLLIGEGFFDNGDDQLQLNDNLYGGKGNDGLSGDLGNDNLYGEDGNDSLVGNQGNDVLFGGTGNDTLNGAGFLGRSVDTGSGSIDTLTAGSGKDTFILQGYNPLGQVAPLYVGSGNSDYALITDFNLQDDVIELARSNGQVPVASPVEYHLGTSPDGLPGGTAIFADNLGTKPDLIAILQNVSPNSVSLDQPYFQFVQQVVGTLPIQWEQPSAQLHLHILLKCRAVGLDCVNPDFSQKKVSG